MSEIIALVTSEIGKCIQRLHSEEGNPSYGADASDELMKELRNKITNLRRIREELEGLL